MVFAESIETGFQVASYASLFFAPVIGAIFVKLFDSPQIANKPNEVIEILKRLRPFPARHLLAGIVHDLHPGGALSTYKVNVFETERGKDSEADLTIIPPASRDATAIMLTDKGEVIQQQGSVKLHIDKSHDRNKPLPFAEQAVDAQGVPANGVNVIGVIWYAKGE